MASGEAPQDIVDSIKEFCKIAHCKENQMNNTASGKLANDCFGKIKGVDVKSTVDASVFPTVWDRTTKTITLNKKTVDTYLARTAMQIIIRAESRKPTDIKEWDTDVQELKTGTLYRLIREKGPKVHATGTSKTGNVDHFTDTKTYGGTHKQRFGKDGHGLGAEGRKDIAKNDGYVPGYANEGTYEKKK